MNDTEYTNEDIDCLVEKISKQQGELEALWEHIHALEQEQTFAQSQLDEIATIARY